MNNFIISDHAAEQMIRRNISTEKVLEIIDQPNQIIKEDDYDIYQSIIIFEDGKQYLLRVFINKMKRPNVVITVYKTSKIKKYYES